MTSFLHCALYLAATGIGAFFLGRLLPKTWFRGDASYQGLAEPRPGHEPYPPRPDA